MRAGQRQADVDLSCDMTAERPVIEVTRLLTFVFDADQAAPQLAGVGRVDDEPVAALRDMCRVQPALDAHPVASGGVELCCQRGELMPVNAVSRLFRLFLLLAG